MAHKCEYNVKDYGKNHNKCNPAKKMRGKIITRNLINHKSLTPTTLIEIGNLR
jgi:hypothetical protein